MSSCSTRPTTVGRPCGSLAVVTTPAGLCRSTYPSCCFATGSPSTSTTSRDSTNVFSSPGSPLTRTRPALISSSAFRREATPARARYAFSRIAVVCRAPARPLVRLDRLAELLVGFGANLQPGQILGVTAYLEMAEAARAVARAAYRRGAKYVDVFWWDQLIKRARLEHADEATLDFVPPWIGQRLRWLSDEHAARVSLSGASATVVRRARPRPHRPRPPPVRRRGAVDRERAHDQLVRGAVPEPGLGDSRPPRARAGRGAGQALGRDRLRAAARQRRPGCGLAGANEGDRRERRPADRAALRLAAPARRRHRPHDRPAPELALARRRLRDRRRPHPLPEPPDRGGLHDAGSGARRRARDRDDAARAVRLVGGRDPDRVRGRARSQDRRRPKAPTRSGPRPRRTTAPPGSARSRSSTRRAGSARSGRSSTRPCSTRTPPATSRSATPTRSRSRTRRSRRART